MKTLQPITDPVAELSPDTKRECALNRLLIARGWLSGAEAFEYHEILRRQRARACAADLAHDQATEAHSFPCNPNIHDD